jgi:hypothetical protein
LILNAYIPNSVVGDTDLHSSLGKIAQEIELGDLTQLENMLTYQAIALQAMFTDMALRASRERSLAAVQSLVQLALRAQSGCRATLQTLAEVKSPRQVAFVRQTNVAQNQQVNNEAPVISRARTRRSAPNKLLAEESDGRQAMDRGAKTSPRRFNPNLVALEAVDRSEDRGRQRKSLQKRL